MTPDSLLPQSSSPVEDCDYCNGIGKVGVERNFLLERQLHGDSSWVGMSSDAMVAQAITGAEHPEWWPGDQHDLARCEATYLRAPEHLKPAMLKTLERFRRHVDEGGLYCHGCDNSIGHSALSGGLCRSCWEEKNPTGSFFGLYPPKVAGK